VIDTWVPQFGLPFLHVPLLKEWMPFVLTPIVLVGYDHRAALSARLRRAYVAFLLLVVTAFGGLDAVRTWHNVVEPPEWDLQAFWIINRVAVMGENFYDARVVHRIAAPLQRADPPLSATAEFSVEVLDAGFKYPPQAMLWMAPFGWPDLRAATIWWYALLTAALLGSVIMLRRVFFPAGGRLELGVVAALVLLLRSTYTTFAFGQTGVLLLLILALLWRDRDRPMAGVWLAAGVLVKPLFAFFVAYPVLRRNWRAAGAFALTLLALTLLTLGVFGREVFVSYFTTDPTQRAPDWLYTEAENQSLLSTLLRLAHYDFARGSPLTYPPFVVAAAVIVGVTLWLLRRKGREAGALGLAAAVPAALLVYPHSLDHYAVLLLVPMLYLWTHREALRLGETFVVTVITVTYALVRYDIGSIVVVANALQWLLFVALGVRAIYARTAEPGARPALRGAAT
jgi:hypothetical protein